MKAENREYDWIILITDGFSSHTRMYNALEAMLKATIFMIFFPSHPSADLQPLGVAIFRAIKPK